jgi:hypothetical protein
MPPDRKRRLRVEGGVPEAHAGSGTSNSLQRCPLYRAALRTGDFNVLAAVLRFHPASRCPAQREAA